MDQVGGEGAVEGGHKPGWTVRLEEDMTEIGIKFKKWRKAARKAGRWSRRVEEGADAFIRKQHDAESCRAAERPLRPRQRNPLSKPLKSGGGGG